MQQMSLSRQILEAESNTEEIRPSALQPTLQHPLMDSEIAFTRVSPIVSAQEIATSNGASVADEFQKEMAAYVGSNVTLNGVDPVKKDGASSCDPSSQILSLIILYDRRDDNEVFYFYTSPVGSPKASQNS